jgi:hypothetical protein
MRNSRGLLVLLAVWLVAPGVRAQGVGIDGDLTREDTVAAGETAGGSVILRNNSAKPQSVKVYQTDYMFFADGRVLYGEPGSTPRSNAKWLTISLHELVVPPNASATVTYTVQAPADPHLLGTYWSMLMFELVPEDVLVPPTSGQGRGVGIRQITRYAVQIATHVGTGGRSELKFADQELVKGADGVYSLRVDLENTGERWLRPSIWMEVFSATGQSLGRFQGAQVRLYPGCSAREDVKLSALAPGDYRALVVADNGDENVFGIQYELTIK